MKPAAIILAAAATLVAAQDFAALLGQLPSCALTCAGKGLAATGCGTTDRNCICADTAYLNATAVCTESSCSPADAAKAAEISKQICPSYSAGNGVAAAAGSASHSSSMTSSMPSTMTTAMSTPAGAAAATKTSAHAAMATGADAVNATKPAGNTTQSPVPYTGAGSNIAASLSAAGLMAVVAVFAL